MINDRIVIFLLLAAGFVLTVFTNRRVGELEDRQMKLAEIVINVEEYSNSEFNKIVMPERWDVEHMDGMRVDWSEMNFAEFIETYPGSHFLHMDFEDVVLTIDWSHAQIEEK